VVRRTLQIPVRESQRCSFGIDAGILLWSSSHVSVWTTFRIVGFFCHCREELRGQLALGGADLPDLLEIIRVTLLESGLLRLGLSGLNSLFDYEFAEFLHYFFPHVFIFYGLKNAVYKKIANKVP